MYITVLGTNIIKIQRRHTRQRQAILDVLSKTKSHPSADWIYFETRKIVPGISKGTVYRNLNLLCDSGRISALSFGNNVSRYEGRQIDHYHFRCCKCGRIFDLEEPVDGQLNEKISRQTGFKVSHHQIEFQGQCNTCQQETK